MTSINVRGLADSPMEEEVLNRVPESDDERVANNISSLIQRVTGTSVEEVDRLIAELESLREMLQDKAVCIQREITEYAHLSRSTIETSKIIAAGLAKLRQLNSLPAGVFEVY